MRIRSTLDSDAASQNFSPEVLEIRPNSLTQHYSEFATYSVDASADPYAGTKAANGKDIWDVEHAADNLNRTGTDWNHDNYGALADGVLTYGFWTYDQFMASYFHELRDSAGEAYNDDAWYAETYHLFEAFRADQKVAAANAIGMWDDLISVTFKEAPAGTEADIMFGAVYMSTAAGAHAYYPQAEAIDDYYGTQGYGKISGDVMINWYYNAPNGGNGGTIVNRPADNSFSNFAYGSYGNFAITHELGHSLGLSHGGDYNASNGSPITYAKDAYFYQDSQQYTIMSYFSGNVTGQSGANLDNLTILYAQTPAVHDIYTVQRMYGADMTTRTGDTVYGFNSTADKGVFDFTLNTHPVLTIWDAGGNDTLDLSGFNSNSIIDLNEGAFSSAGYKVTDAVKAQDMAALGITTEAQWQSFLAKYALNPDGSLHDNIGIAYGAKIENAIGGVGNDTMTGNALNNFLSGGAGNDTFKGGAGVDVITMGAGKDVFVAEVTADKTAFKGPAKGNMSWDIITDFTTGQDHIDLRGLAHMDFRGSSASKGSDVTFKTFTSVNGAENALGINIHDHYGVTDLSGPVTVVFGNVDGGAPDFAIVLLNHNGVSAGDFIFG